MSFTTSIVQRRRFSEYLCTFPDDRSNACTTMPIKISSYRRRRSSNNILYDPGLLATVGMDLKHMKRTTTPYGFPILEKPAIWSIDESIFFADQTNTEKSRSSPPQSPQSIKKDASQDSLSNSGNNRSGRRGALASFPATLGRSARCFPVVYTNLKSDTTAAAVANSKSSSSVAKESSASSTTTASHRRIQISCETSERNVNVTIHSVCIPSRQMGWEFRVEVWIGNYGRNSWCRKQATKWMPQICFVKTQTYLFGETMVFAKRSSSLCLYFKVTARRQCNPLISRWQQVGTVAVPLREPDSPLFYVTRLLENTRTDDNVNNRKLLQQGCI